MNPTPDSIPRRMAACSIVSHAFVEMPFSAVPALRDAPAPDGAPALPPRFLRHCDEQAVVAMHAVLRAIAAHPARQASFAGYGVVAASCQAGQIQAAKVLADFGIGGAVRVSPHIVPQCSLHSIAGALSVALGMHGPNIGVGGGPDALEEGLMAAVTLLHEPAGSDHTGVFLVASEWDPEPTLSHDGTLVDDPLCRAFAVALEPEAADGPTLTLEFAPAAVPGPGRDDSADDGRGRLRSFSQALAMCVRGGALVSWGLPCSWGICARVSGAAEAPAPAAEPRPSHLRKAA